MFSEPLPASWCCLLVRGCRQAPVQQPCSGAALERPACPPWLVGPVAAAEIIGAGGLLGPARLGLAVACLAWPRARAAGTCPIQALNVERSPAARSGGAANLQAIDQKCLERVRGRTSAKEVLRQEREQGGKPTPGPRGDLVLVAGFAQAQSADLP